MKIAESTANLLMDAMAMMFVKTYFACQQEIPDVDDVEEIVRSNFVMFCEDNGIEEVVEGI